MKCDGILFVSIRGGKMCRPRPLGKSETRHTRRILTKTIRKGGFFVPRKDKMSYIYYNPNPKQNRVGDCTIRAITKATGLSWEKIYSALSTMGFILSDMPSSNHVWGAYLKREGFKRYIVDDKGNDIYTVKDFCRDNPTGTYILAIDGHVVCVTDGNYYDAWDSGDEIPIYFWTR